MLLTWFWATLTGDNCAGDICLGKIWSGIIFPGEIWPNPMTTEITDLILKIVCFKVLEPSLKDYGYNFQAKLFLATVFLFLYLKNCLPLAFWEPFLITFFYINLQTKDDFTFKMISDQKNPFQFLFIKFFFFT